MSKINTKTTLLSFLGAAFLAFSMQSIAAGDSAYKASVKSVDEDGIKGKFVQRDYIEGGMPVLKMATLTGHKAKSDELLIMRAFRLIEANDLDGFISLYTPAVRDAVRAYYKENINAWDERRAKYAQVSDVRLIKALGLGNNILQKVEFLKDKKVVATRYIKVWRARKVYYLNTAAEVKNHRLNTYFTKHYDFGTAFMPIK